MRNQDLSTVDQPFCIWAQLSVNTIRFPSVDVVPSEPLSLHATWAGLGFASCQSSSRRKALTTQQITALALQQSLPCLPVWEGCSSPPGRNQVLYFCWERSVKHRVSSKLKAFSQLLWTHLLLWRSDSWRYYTLFLDKIWYSILKILG